ncbi:hypothetical protein OF83DRAFT_1058882 [Amylostereum chailletii]|nr:hypothetical protein OF83DRAFT_1058882 [Amylostereum chailletii]
MPSSPTRPPPGIRLVPPPWSLHAKSWIFSFKCTPSFLADDTSESANPNNTPAILQGLPPGSYPPLEILHPYALAPVKGKPQCKRNTASCCLLRYSDSPVGPYDEFIMLAGGFSNPLTKEVTRRITTIYVSSPASVWNGRKNWNIPKNVARFEWRSTGSNTTTVKIYHPEGVSAPLSTTKPFFTAVLSDSRLPSVSVPHRLLRGRSRMIQPPLLPARHTNDYSSVEIGTDDSDNGGAAPWLSVAPVYKGRWGVSYIHPLPKDQGGLEGYGDGIGYPEMNPISRGMSFEGVIDFPAADVVGSKA